MTDIAVIILVGREEIHIRRCLEKLAPLNPRQIFVVESQEGDRTHEIAVETGRTLGWNVVVGDQLLVAGDGENHGEKIQPTTNHQQPTTNNQQPTTTLHTVFRTWPGNQATQFDWVLDNVKIETSWILRIDADEYLLPELIEEIKQKLAMLSDNVVGVTLKRRNYFAGGWVKRGVYPVSILRMFRSGHGQYAEGMVMDERMEVDGQVVELDNDFVDHSLISMDDWRSKHRDYAKREASQVLNGQFHDKRKIVYYKLPRYCRAFLYFCIRYFLKLGFLDGLAGWRWHFWQGLWYRCLVDYKIGQMKHR